MRDRMFRLTPQGTARGRAYFVAPAAAAGAEAADDLLLYALGGSLAAARVRAQTASHAPTDVADLRSVQQQIAAAGPALVSLAPILGDTRMEEFAVAFAAALLEEDTSPVPPVPA